MASYLVFDTVDIHGAASPLRFRIEDQTPPAGAVTLATNLAAALFGATKISQAGFSVARLEIDSLIAPVAAQADSDVTQNWQGSLLLADGTEGSRLGIPGRNDLTTLYAAGAYPAANLSNAAWAALVTAMVGGAVDVVNTKDAGTITGFEKAIATVRARKRPRVGGRR